MKPTNTQTIIERAIDFIRTNGSARTPQLAEHLALKSTAIAACLYPAVQAGYLVTCLVESEGSKRTVSEYRLSSLVSESSQTWGAFKEARRNALTERPLKVPPARPPRVPAAANAPIPEAPSTAVPKPAEVARPEPPLVIGADFSKSGDHAVRIVFMIDTNGRLRIELVDKTITLSNEETRDVGELLVASEPIWS